MLVTCLFLLLVVATALSVAVDLVVWAQQLPPLNGTGESADEDLD